MSGMADFSEVPQHEESQSPQSVNTAMASGTSWQPDPDFIAKLECYLQWWRANTPRDHPGLTDIEYGGLCIQVMLDCGLELPVAWRTNP